MNIQSLELPALGRPFSLGQLYDARREAIVPLSLWNKQKLEDYVITKDKFNTAFTVSARDSINDKCQLLNISVEAKLGILSGLVEARGSGKYIRDTKKSKNVVRVSFGYHVETFAKQLSMDVLGEQSYDHSEMFDKDVATHVVVMILYGADAVFVFEKATDSEKKKQELEAKLEACVNKIPKCNAGVSFEGRSGKELEELVVEVSCTFHGDFFLRDPPTTFSEAISTYQRLPGLLGETGEKSVPLRVWLYPLEKLDSRARRLTAQIGFSIVSSAEREFQELQDLSAELDELRFNHPTAQKLSNLKRILNKMAINLDTFRSEFGHKMATMITEVRAGNTEEGKLVDLMKQRNTSPYSSSDFGDWIECKKREANVLNQCCGPETTVTQRSELDELLCDHTVKFVIALNIKVFGKDDYTEYADKYNQGRRDENPRQLEPTPMYQKMARVRTTVGRFKEFMESNSHITTTRFAIIEETRGSTEETDVHLVLYRDGVPVTNDFCPPSAVSGLQVLEPRCNQNPEARFHTKATVSWTAPTEEEKLWMTGFSVFWRIHGDLGWQELHVNKDIHSVNLDRLELGTRYQIRVCATSQSGTGTFTEAQLNTTQPSFRHHLADARLNVLVIGRSGSGKSTLINTIRGLHPLDEGAAKVGVCETTTEVHAYPHPANSGFVVWDVPGCGTPSFRRETYLDQIQLSRFDLCLIVTRIRISEYDVWLAQEGIRRRKPVFIVRTNIDADLKNAQTDYPETFDETECLQKLKKDVTNSTERLGLTNIQPNSFLISGKLHHRTRWDFPDLIRTLGIIGRINAAGCM